MKKKTPAKKKTPSNPGKKPVAPDARARTAKKAVKKTAKKAAKKKRPPKLYRLASGWEVHLGSEVEFYVQVGKRGVYHEGKIMDIRRDGAKFTVREGRETFDISAEQITEVFYSAEDDRRHEREARAIRRMILGWEKEGEVRPLADRGRR